MTEQTIRSPRKMTAIARKLRVTSTEAEKRLLRLLRGRRFAGAKFRRQTPIGPYVADFVCEQAKLIIELDGSQHADSRRDVHRTADLERLGYRVLRVWNNDLTGDIEAVLQAIYEALPQTPQPSPAPATPASPFGRGRMSRRDRKIAPRTFG